MLEVIKIAYPSKNEFDGKVFYYLDYGKETHGRTSFRLWIHHTLLSQGVSQSNILKFPVKNAKLFNGKKQSTKILRPDSDYWTIDMYVDCGFRGKSYINIIKPSIDDLILNPYYIYSSPRGSTGISTGLLASIPNSFNFIIVNWRRTGRLYGGIPDGMAKITQDGLIETLDDVSDIYELDEIEDIAETKE